MSWRQCDTIAGDISGDAMKFAFLLIGFFAFIQDAVAHHLEDYDAHIRAEAKLPDEWFSCKKKDDCTLVSVPCRSGLAVNSVHMGEAREALITAFPFCLGQSIDDTEAACEHGQCVTKSEKDK
jgi:hypothetical protein